MFKKAILIFAALVFALAILITSIWRTAAKTYLPTVQAQEAELREKVDYYLPYPGILPDHFLYPVKMIRDKLLVFFTTEPLKRAELFLLFADKRIGAAKSLIEGGKQELGITTLTKAEKYLEKAVSQERLANEKGKETRSFLEKLAKASLKHEELLLEIRERVGESSQGIIDDLLSYPRRAYKQTVEILEK